jgi:lipopolysaccharide biosynthesis protein
MKAIAFHLPQFHPIPENDEWWGKGFTEPPGAIPTVSVIVLHFQSRAVSAETN